MLKRAIEEKIEEYLKGKDYKTFYVWGPRRSGKTTLLKKLSKKLEIPIFNFDYSSNRQMFIPDKATLEKLVSAHKIILIDEVQQFPEATVVLKILYDEFKVKVIATGSSELRHKANQEFDSQAGRFTQHYCLPLSISEIKANTRLLAYEEKAFEKSLLEKLQIFGAYPEVYAQEGLSDDQKIGLLENIVDAYVLKDIIDIYQLKDTALARNILIKIALQIGSEVSVREIAASLGSNGVTVANYIEIFIKNHILISLPSFRTNTRKAVSENRKLYFYDLGIRNALVKDFRETELRPDRGGVFENFIISELEKTKRLLNAKVNMYFYREYGGKEVDIVLEDYKKNYTTIEVKVDKGRAKDIFPLPNISETLNMQNYFEGIAKALKSK